MPFQLPQHVKRRGNTLYLNLPIPAAIRAHFLTSSGSPKTHIVEALGTSDLREAVEQVRLRSGIWAAKFKTLQRPQRGAIKAAHSPELELARELREALAAERQRESDPGHDTGEEALLDRAQEHAERIEASAGLSAAQQFYAVATKTDAMTLREAVRLMAEGGTTTSGTNKKREQQLHDLLGFLKVPDCLPAFVTEARAVAYVEHLNRSALAKSTKQDRLSGLQTVWSFLQRKRQVPRGTSPWVNHDVTEPAAGGAGQDKRGWTEAELLKLFRAPEPAGRRHYVRSLFRELYALGLITGMRLDEIVSLKPRAVERMRGGYLLTVEAAKTEAGEREVPVVHPAAVAILKRRLAAQKDKGASIFPECRPGGPDKKPSWQVQKAMGRDRDALGFGRGVDFHSTRRTFMTLMENADISVVPVQRYVGHHVPTMMHKVYSDGASRESLRKVAAAVKYSAKVEAELRKAAGL